MFRAISIISVFTLAVSLTHTAIAQDISKMGPRLTIYANGLALVDEVRKLDGKGQKTVRLDRVGPMIITDSVRLTLNNGPALHEIALDSDILNRQTLLARSLGKTVQLVRVNPATGAETIEQAEVLSIAGGLVLRVGGRIETNPPGRIVFNDVPADLNATPTLSLTFAESLKAPIDAQMAYLTSGVTWNAVYTAVLTPKHDQLDLNAWAKVTNNVGVDFANADVSLVAGDVRRESPAPRGKILMRAEAMATSDSSSFNAPRSELSAFHMYSMPGRVTLRNKETRQLRLLDAKGVKSERVLEYRSGAPVFGPVRGTQRPQPVRQRVKFLNNTDSKLGVPLPAGVLRAYVHDSEGALRFIGEDRINNTAVGNEVSLDLGRAFDVTVKRQQTDFKRTGDRTTETAFTLTFRNGGTSTSVVKVTEEIPGDWEILSENMTHRRDGISATWDVSVPENGQMDLTYRVRVRR